MLLRRDHFILGGQHCPNIKARQEHYKKRKLHVNIPYNIDVKYLQENTIKLNSADYSPGPSRIYSCNVKMLQYVKINHVINHVNRMKGQNFKQASQFMQKKACDKIKCSFKDKNT